MLNSMVKIISFVFIIIFGILYFFPINKTEVLDFVSGDEQVDKKSTIELPKFIFGIVSRVEDQKIFVDIEGIQKIVLINENTKLISQIKDGVGYKNVTIQIEDIKASAKIAVYYEEDSVIGVSASRIQILDF